MILLSDYMHRLTWWNHNARMTRNWPVCPVGRLTFTLPTGFWLGAAKGLSSALDAVKPMSGIYVQPMYEHTPHIVSL